MYDRRNIKLEIPETFYSYDEEELFKVCITCERNLLKDGTRYMIEKAIKRYPKFNTKDVVFEYAMCLDCVDKMRTSMSKVSRQKIDAFFLERISKESRTYVMDDRNEIDFDDCISKCMVNGKTIDDISEYQIMAYCCGDKIDFPFLPFMLSGEVLEELQELISEETRDEMDDFIDEHFGLPPEYKDLIKPKDLILI